MKPYVIIKGGSADPYGPLQRGGRGVQKSKKMPYVIYERPLKPNQIKFKKKIKPENYTTSSISMFPLLEIIHSRYIKSLRY